MKTLLFGTALALATGLSVPAQADVVYKQHWYQWAGGPDSETGAQEIADQIVLAKSASVHRVTWRGSYNHSDPWVNGDSVAFQIRFFVDGGNVPAEPAFASMAVLASVTDTGIPGYYSTRDYIFEAPVSVDLAAGTTYWLSITESDPRTDYDRMTWDTAVLGAGTVGAATRLAYPDNTTPWRSICNDPADYRSSMAFTLYGSQAPGHPVFMFYNNSAWDGGDGTANAADDNAITLDKDALQPGTKATFANYTSYDKGINGLMIDVFELPATPTLNDFLFRKGNDNQPYGNDLTNPSDDWPRAPDPIAISIRRGAGQDGADRMTLIWADGAIRNCWLQVTVLATDATGLAADEVYYVGNAVGESGNSTGDALVNATDEIGARNNPHAPVNPAGIVDPYDFNRDKLVNATDQILARNNRTSPLTALKLITPPLEPAGGGD